jgi:hypothetical protein
MAMTEPRAIKRFIGHDVDVAYWNGARARGRLLNVNQRSVWLVADDEDRIIRLCEIVDLRAAS